MVILSESQTLMIIGFLGRQDSLFKPFRRPHEDWYGSAWALRREYHTTGFSWKSGESGEAEQKRAERDLTFLRVAELVICRREKTKTTGIRLTDSGDQMARAIAGIPGVDGGLATLLDLRRQVDLRRAEGRELFDGWVEEVALTNGVGWGDGGQETLAKLEIALMPALVRGWAESACDTAGRVYYRPVGELPTVRIPSNLPPAVEDGPWIYDDDLGNARDELKLMDRSQDIGPVPLPSSMGLEARRR